MLVLEKYPNTDPTFIVLSQYGHLTEPVFHRIYRDKGYDLEAIQAYIASPRVTLNEAQMFLERTLQLSHPLESPLFVRLTEDKGGLFYNDVLEGVRKIRADQWYDLTGWDPKADVEDMLRSFSLKPDWDNFYNRNLDSRFVFCAKPYEAWSSFLKNLSPTLMEILIIEDAPGILDKISMSADADPILQNIWDKTEWRRIDRMDDHFFARVLK